MERIKEIISGKKDAELLMDKAFKDFGKKRKYRNWTDDVQTL